MSKLSNNFTSILNERGFIQDSTNLELLEAELKTKPSFAYIGYDATAKSLHVGHLVNIMMLRWFQKCGHRPITLMGGGTTRIGDPSFRSEERPLLDIDQINLNINSMKVVFDKFLNYAGSENNAVMINNSEWLENINYIEFLRTVGKHFSVNRMLSFDSVKSRLERDQSLSFLEFNYMILQAYDFLELSRRFNCILQMGGSDQWGNIVNGIDLTRRITGTTVFGITSPLLTTAAGNKMGKSRNGAVWLNKDLTSPYEFWQFWRNTDDRDVGKFFKLFTELPIQECEHLTKLKDFEVNEAKVLLANEVTTLCHGKEAAALAEETATEVFKKGELGKELPTFTIKKSELDMNVTVSNLFLTAKLVNSGKEAKRLISEGGARLDDKVIKDFTLKVRQMDLSKPIRLSAGKKRHAIIVVD